MSTNNEPESHWITRAGWSLEDGTLLVVGIEPHSEDGRAFKALLHGCDDDDPQVCRIQNGSKARLLEKKPFLTAFHIYRSVLGAARAYKIETDSGYKIDPRVFVAWADRCQYTIPSQLESLRTPVPNVAAEMQVHIADLEAQLKEANLRQQMFDELSDRDGDYCATELDCALQAYRAARKDSSDASPRERIEKWLKQSGYALKPTAIKRIATVANWGKDPGRRPKGPEK